MRYHYIPIRILKLKRLTIPSAGKEVEHLNSHILLAGTENDRKQ